MWYLLLILYLSEISTSHLNIIYLSVYMFTKYLYILGQESTKYGPWAKSRHTHLFIYYLWLLSHYKGIVE